MQQDFFGFDMFSGQRLYDVLEEDVSATIEFVGLVDPAYDLGNQGFMPQQLAQSKEPKHVDIGFELSDFKRVSFSERWILVTR